MKPFVPKPGAATKLDPAKGPKPPVVTTTNFGDFESMPFSIQMLTKSELALSESPLVYKGTVMLYAQSWHQIPPGSLPNDDLALAHLSGLNLDYPAVKNKVLKDWFLATDNRLYNYTVAARVKKGLKHKEEKNLKRSSWCYKRERSRRKVAALKEICLQHQVAFDSSKNSITYLTELLDEAGVAYQLVLNEIEACYKDEVEAENQANQLQQTLEMGFVADGGAFFDDPEAPAAGPVLAGQMPAADTTTDQIDRPVDPAGRAAAPAPKPPSYVFSQPDGKKEGVLHALDGISSAPLPTADSAQTPAQSMDPAKTDAHDTDPESYKWGDRAGSESYKYPEPQKPESYKSSNEAISTEKSYKSPKQTDQESYKWGFHETQNHKNAVPVQSTGQSSNFMISEGQLAENTPSVGDFETNEPNHKNAPNDPLSQNTHKTGISMISKPDQNHKNDVNDVVFTPKSDLSTGTSPSCPRTNTYKTEQSSEIAPSSESKLSVKPKGKGSTPPSPNPTPPHFLDPARVGEGMDDKKAKAGKEEVKGEGEPLASSPPVNAALIVPQTASSAVAALTTASGDENITPVTRIPNKPNVKSQVPDVESAVTADGGKKRRPRGKTDYNPFTHPVPSWIPLEPWTEWLEMRQARAGKSVRTPATIKRSIELLDAMRHEGYDVQATILKSIRQEWTDFYRRDEHKLGAVAGQLPGAAARPALQPPPAVRPLVSLDKPRLLPPGVLQEPPGLVPSVQADGPVVPAWALSLLEGCQDDAKRLLDLKRHIEVYAQSGRVPAGIALTRYPFVPKDKEVRLSLGSIPTEGIATKPPPGESPGAQA